MRHTQVGTSALPIRRCDVLPTQGTTEASQTPHPCYYLFTVGPAMPW
jgi:hypothetical protein